MPERDEAGNLGFTINNLTRDLDAANAALAAAEAEVQRLRAENEWRPIETADQSEGAPGILCLRDGSFPFMCHWVRDGDRAGWFSGHYTNNGQMIFQHPKLWRHISLPGLAQAPTP